MTVRNWKLLGKKGGTKGNMRLSTMLLISGLLLCDPNARAGQTHQHSLLRRQTVENEASTSHDQFMHNLHALLNQLRLVRDSQGKRAIIQRMATLHDQFYSQGRNRFDRKLSLRSQHNKLASQSANSRTLYQYFHKDEVGQTYHVPFGSSGNRIEFAIPADLFAPASEAKVGCIEKPESFHLSPASQLISHIHQYTDRTAVFALSVDKVAPTNKKQDMRFLVKTDRGELQMTIGIIVDLPEKFELFQNYPNPFNPSTIISYTLPHDDRVIIKVYDILGREAKTVVDEVQEAGYKVITLDATQLASGVYFCKLQVGTVVDTKKLVLVR